MDNNAIAVEETVTATNPVIFNGTLYKTGYIYKLTGGTADEYMYSTNTLTAVPAGYTAASEGGVVKAVAAAPAYTQINTDDYISVVGTAATGAKVADDGEWFVVDANGNISKGSGEIDQQALAAKKLSEADSVAPLLAYAFAQGGYYESRSDYGNNGGVWGWGVPTYQLGWAASKEKTYPWLPTTTYARLGTDASRNGMETIRRDDVWVLSRTNDYTSTGGSTFGSETAAWSKYQSYDETMTSGTRPIGFSGLASQVAEFFNKQNNGTITFEFTATSTAGGGDQWQSGIPSTEVGLIGSGAGTVTSNFALFFNYESTGGTTLSKAKADLTAGTVTFDIEEYLDKCGGLTSQTLHDIYYGLNVGYYDKDQNDKYGMYVKKVTLAYDDAAAATDADATDATDATDVSADDDDDNQDVVSTDDDDDDDDDDFADDDDDDDQWADDTDDDDEGFDDDDDDASLEDDTNDDDDNVANDTNVTTGDDATSDENPGTGAGLAVIPAIVAAAAVAVSKKRK